MRKAAVLLTIVAASALAAAQAPATQAERMRAAMPTAGIGEISWYVIAADNGDRVGFAWRQIVRTPEGREVIDHSQVRLRDTGGNEPSPRGSNRSMTQRITERSVTRLDRSGRVVSISDSSQMGLIQSSVEVRVSGDVAEVTRVAQGDRRTLRVPLPPGTRFDGGEGLFADWDMRAQPRLEFSNFNIVSMAPERVVIAAVNGGAPDAEGRIALLRTRYDGQELRAVARLQLDRQRRIVSISQPMFGTHITTRTSDRETALRPHQPYQAMQNAMVRAPYRVPDEAVFGHLRFRFSFQGGVEFPLPQTGEQRVRTEGEQVVVDICQTCGPGLATDAASLADARRPTPWLQSDHPRLIALAMPVARMQVSETRKMELLLSRAMPLIPRVDYGGHFSALEALDRRAGDCTESAVLLATLGRAAGIPTRVVSGLTYSRVPILGTANAFMPHSWVVAYVDGRWKSFDLALERFDSSHIALTVGDGDARSIMAASQLASLLRWETMVEVRRRPAA
ncbi:MAG TPA: transglutaminase domain-containing protein [Allosphingosinicella sp.]|nr:transglutaminase domain-containing protein [Allosphingosinicella sp.]